MKRIYLWIVLGIALIVLAVVVGMMVSSDAGTAVGRNTRAQKATSTQRTSGGQNPNMIVAAPPGGGEPMGDCYRPENGWQLVNGNISLAGCQLIVGWGQWCPHPRPRGSSACTYNTEDWEWPFGFCYLDNGTSTTPPDITYPMCANGHGSPPRFDRFCYDEAQQNCDYNPERYGNFQ